MPEPKLVFAGPALAAMLALSGCGGGGGGGPLANLPDILVDATKAGETAKGAAVAAREAVDMAGIAVGGLTVVAVQGDSTRAQLNAQAVLDAEAAVEAQLAIAQEALKAAQDARSAAQALQDALNAQLFLANIDGQVSKAAAHVDEIAGLLREGAVLAGYVETVKAHDGNRTPGEIGQDVATAVAEVIGTGAVPDSDFTAPALSARPQSAAPLALTGTSGMTWAEIHGKGDGDNLAVSIAGMTAVEIAAQFGSPPVDGYASGARVNGAYRGIPGFAQCQGTCTVGTAGSDEGKLVGNWIFLPSFPNQGYVRNEDGSYAPPADYAEYGHWLDWDPANGNAPRLNLYIGGTSSGSEPGDLSARAADADNHDGDVARYEGRAAGMSLTRETDAGGMTVPGSLKSGAFTADVHLTARFGTAPTVSGHVDNFDGGAHVNGAWRVDLETTGLLAGTVGTGIADGGGAPGTWSSDPYAPDGNVRPTGINGTFHAHFGDGHAMGVYATRNSGDDADDM
ncbi:MAG: hypothetical protein F4103_08155 [Boseongicola sp. SB0673_bin_14]|nr:hypothetical protein [Boseongicola sp. SB0667_bin_21]MYI68698.1 hypothetical protein [Boseongicola sp. SB0673_bin_14]